MKKLVFTLLALVAINYTYSQEKTEEVKADEEEMQTLFKGIESNGGYGSLVVRYSQLDGKDGVQVGGRAGWIINHNFVIGMGGSGVIGMAYVKDYSGEKKNVRNNLGYGGLLFEKVFFPKKAIHFSVPVLIGAGGLAVTPDYNYDDNNQDDWDENDIEASAFFVVEPGIEMEMNLFKFMRFNIGAYYRATSKVSIDGMSSGAANGFSVGATIKFGIF